MKVAKDSSLEKLFVKLRNWYLEKDDEASRNAVAYTFDAVNRHNPDKIKSSGSQTMPVAFLAMHEELRKGENDEILEIWEEVWSDGVPGTEGGIQLYLKEIMALLTVAIESQQWKMKAQAARAMGKIAQKLEKSISVEDEKKILFVLINALSGRTWTGKESVLIALADNCSHSDIVARKILEDPKIAEGLTEDQLVSCLLRECKKESNFEYRLTALRSTGIIIQSLKLNCFDALFEIVFPVIRKDEEMEDEQEDKPKDDDDEKEEDSSEKLDLRLAIYECLEQCWPESVDVAQKILMDVLGTLKRRAEATTKKNVQGIAKLLKSILLKTEISVLKGDSFPMDATVEVGKIISVILAVPKSSQLRGEGLEILALVIEELKMIGKAEISESFKEEVSKSLDDVIKDVSSEAAIKINARKLKTSLEALK